MTSAQMLALRLAAGVIADSRGPEAIRYYRGGWYTTTAVAGADQRAPRFPGGCDTRTCTATIGTLRALESRGLLSSSGIGYERRWAITEEGRAMLAAAGVRVSP